MDSIPFGLSQKFTVNTLFIVIKKKKKKSYVSLFEVYNLFYSILIEMVNNNEDLSNNVIER